MRLISKYEIQAIAVESMHSWRSLERARYQYHMVSPDPTLVLSVLDTYQRSDGGFGNGIEPDFWLPDSSPMATSVGLAYLSELEPTQQVVFRINRALSYLKTTYNPTLKGWKSVPEMVNKYPHAPWWHYTEPTSNELTQWGNPTMELVGYFLKWQPDEAETDFKEVLDFAERYLMSMDPQHYEEHEIYCYLRAYPYLKSHRQARLYPVLKQAVHKLVKTSPDDWEKYVPKPLDFVQNPQMERFDIKPELLTAQINYQGLQLLNHHTIDPPWTWEPWPGLAPNLYWENWKADWPIARDQWSGILSLKTLIQLKDYGCIK